MFHTLSAWLKKIDWYRVKRTAIQVFGPTLIVFLLDWGVDGAVVLRDYVFGNEGIIVIGTLALATAMNLPKKVKLDASDIGS